MPYTSMRIPYCDEMLKNCLNCDEQFEGDERKFCSWECNETYKKILTALDQIIKDGEERAHEKH